MVQSSRHGNMVTITVRHNCQDCQSWNKGCANPEMVPMGAHVYLPPAKEVNVINDCRLWKPAPPPFTLLSKRVYGHKRSAVNNLTGAGYGIRLKIKSWGDFIEPGLTSMKIEMDGRVYEVPLGKRFYETGIIVDRRIGRFMLLHRIAPWEPRKNAHLQLHIPKEGIYRLEPEKGSRRINLPVRATNNSGPKSPPMLELI